MDREQLSTDKLLKYEIKADQGPLAIDGIAVENPFVYVYEIEENGSPKSSKNYEISLLTFFQEDSLKRLPGSIENDLTITVPEYQLVVGDERNPLGVWCHEFGHELYLPDFYDTDQSSEGVGNWAVMAAGAWGNNGETPVYFSAFSRIWLGWDEAILVDLSLIHI